MSRCTEGKKKPKLKGKKPKYVCKRCGWEALRKKDLCKANKK